MLVSSIDISSAFDIIQRLKILETCSKLFSEDDLSIIRCLLSGTCLKMKVNDKTSKSLSTNVGVPQGDSLSPILFTLYLKDALSHFPPQLARKEFINADDMNLITEKKVGVSTLKNILRKSNLIVNQDTTKSLILTPI